MNSSEQLTVDLGERSYPIFIGEQLITNSDLLKQYLPSKKVVVVSNETVAPLYLPTLQQTLQQLNKEIVTIILADGEQYKNWQSMEMIFTSLLQNYCERNTCIIALGGGVVGDITGFAAACYQRGAPFIQIPTTLLAQVDSSVGGKTAINHPLGKNMIGAFYQPLAVFADLATLKTLPAREFAAGLAEVIKYALINDYQFFLWLENNLDRLLAGDLAAIKYAVKVSCSHKAQIVIADEKESGVRALLNLGHTFGHAIETAGNYTSHLHGEAVAIGTYTAATLSHLLGWLNSEQLQQIEQIFTRAGLPTRGPKTLSDVQYCQLMQHDKKASEGKITLILLDAIGQAKISRGIELSLIKQAIALCREN